MSQNSARRIIEPPFARWPSAPKSPYSRRWPETDALLTNKRKNEEGTFIVDATCPTCEASRTLAFFHWSAVICSGCGCELVRPKFHGGGPGRPSGSGAGMKSRTFRMSDQEWATVTELASARGMSRSAYLRAVALLG